jgi:hypothetical protein
MKSLAFAADADELIFLYGFSMPVSPFDRLGEFQKPDRCVWIVYECCRVRSNRLPSPRSLDKDSSSTRSIVAVRGDPVDVDNMQGFLHHCAKRTLDTEIR